MLHFMFLNTIMYEYL